MFVLNYFRSSYKSTYDSDGLITFLDPIDNNVINHLKEKAKNDKDLKVPFLWTYDIENEHINYMSHNNDYTTYDKNFKEYVSLNEIDSNKINPDKINQIKLQNNLYDHDIDSTYCSNSRKLIIYGINF